MLSDIHCMAFALCYQCHHIYPSWKYLTCQVSLLTTNVLQEKYNYNSEIRNNNQVGSITQIPKQPCCLNFHLWLPIPFLRGLRRKAVSCILFPEPQFYAPSRFFSSHRCLIMTRPQRYTQFPGSIFWNLLFFFPILLVKETESDCSAFPFRCQPVVLSSLPSSSSTAAPPLQTVTSGFLCHDFS